MTAVAIVDDDLWVREGRAGALRDRGHPVVWVSSHVDALERERWDDVEVLLVDAHDPDAGFDRFVGVSVVERVRARGGDRTRVVVLTGHLLNDLLRIRMADAGADELYHHGAVRSPDDLVALVSGPLPIEPTPPPASRPGSDLTGAVRWAERELGEEALRSDLSQKALPVSRRHLITARQKLGRMTGLSATGDRSAPEWRRVLDLIDRARGAERRSGDR